MQFLTKCKCSPYLLFNSVEASGACSSQMKKSFSCICHDVISYDIQPTSVQQYDVQPVNGAINVILTMSFICAVDVFVF